MPRTPTRRNTELLLLLGAIGIVLIFSAAAEAGSAGEVTADFWVLPVMLGLVLLAAHVVVRFVAPYADPVILPAVALLNGLGVVFLRRLDLGELNLKDRAGLSVFSGLGFKQLIWTLVAIGLFSALLIVVRDHKSISRYAYSLGLAGVVLVAIPAVLPSSLSEVNGAKLWVRLGPVSFQPGEFAKVALLCFFAYYLVRKREVLSLASKRIAGIDFPRGRDLGPVLAVWLFSMLVLVFEQDLGTALMYFGMFVVMLYIATERVSWILIGLGTFAGGAVLAHSMVSRLQLRVSIWWDPFSDARGKGYQLVQSLLGFGTGGLFGTGPGAGQPTIIPEAENDFITAGFGEEIGLFGLTALLCLYMVVVMRGLRTAVGVRDSFGKLLAGGLSFTLGLQVFVIVGGVTKLIPLTGQTTPFLSAGGSSLMANWLLIALLIRISDAARRPVLATPKEPLKLQDAHTEVIRT
ncbi:FtsW/RodA/SpoVE family cell cycle protein [Longispora albida]|uniref:FtsW/RodA/SpoVE family cell cycle protein n=1 Tax=Longispora albida TaxID=203523 RepID=UPI00037A3203|nr:FtsW/RodA/SpoVE family cell cycle protein [Longispora albida]